MVNTYLLQFNPPHEKISGPAGRTFYQGEVTFDRPIIGVVTSGQQLKETDKILGKRRFTYPTHVGRGLERGDSLNLSEDRRTLSFNWQVHQAVTNGMDQVRVIVDSLPPL